MKSKIEEAQSTCDGLHRLIRRMHGAAVDLDKGGESAHELLALLASTNDCVSNLSLQLKTLDQGSGAPSNVAPINKASHATAEPASQTTTNENEPLQQRAAAARY